MPRLLASVWSKWTPGWSQREPTLDLLPCHSDSEACLPCSFRVSSVEALAFKEVPLGPRAEGDVGALAGCRC